MLGKDEAEKVIKDVSYCPDLHSFYVYLFFYCPLYQGDLRANFFGGRTIVYDAGHQGTVE